MAGAKTTDNTRKLDIMYSLVSFFLSGFFFWVASFYLTQQEIVISSWEFWENVLLVFFGLFFLGAGIYGLSHRTKHNGEDGQEKSANREIAKMILLIVVLAIALWVIFRFGVE